MTQLTVPRVLSTQVGKYLLSICSVHSTVVRDGDSRMWYFSKLVFIMVGTLSAASAAALEDNWFILSVHDMLGTLLSLYLIESTQHFMTQLLITQFFDERTEFWEFSNYYKSCK